MGIISPIHTHTHTHTHHLCLLLCLLKDDAATQLGTGLGPGLDQPPQLPGQLLSPHALRPAHPRGQDSHVNDTSFGVCCRLLEGLTMKPGRGGGCKYSNAMEEGYKYRNAMRGVTNTVMQLSSAVSLLFKDFQACMSVLFKDFRAASVLVYEDYSLGFPWLIEYSTAAKQST